MITISFPVITARLETLLDEGGKYLDTDESGRNRLEFRADSLFHIQVARSQQGLACQMLSCLRGANNFRDLRLLAALGIDHGRFEVLPLQFLTSGRPPEWTGKFRVPLPQGDSFELALVVGLRAVCVGVKIPTWVTFSGAFHLIESPAELRFATTEKISEKVRLALGLNGYELYDPLLDAFNTNLDDALQSLGAFDSRCRPGHIRLMFVPESGFDKLRSDGLLLENQPLKESLPRGLGSGPNWDGAARWLSERFRVVDCDDYRTRRMLVVGARDARQVLRFLRLEEGHPEGLRAMVVGLPLPRTETLISVSESGAPPVPAIDRVQVAVPNCRTDRSSVRLTLCRIPAYADSVICMLDDAVTEELFAALSLDLPPSHSQRPWPRGRTMTLTEAVKNIENGLDLLRKNIQELCSDVDSRPVLIRLPRLSEWRKAVTDEELLDPRRCSQSVIDGPVETGAESRGAQRRIVANALGLFNLLGNVQELVVADDGDEEPYLLVGYSNGSITEQSLTHSTLPIDRFTGRKPFSFRVVFEFRDEHSWHSFCAEVDKERIHA